YRINLTTGSSTQLLNTGYGTNSSNGPFRVNTQTNLLARFGSQLIVHSAVPDTIRFSHVDLSSGTISVVSSHTTNSLVRTSPSLSTGGGTYFVGKGSAQIPRLYFLPWSQVAGASGKPSMRWVGHGASSVELTGSSDVV